MSAETTASAAPGAPVLRDRYELGERLAEGTIFYTHRGRDLKAGAEVAIKVLKPEYAGDEAFASRLLTESSSAVSLLHPNIARVFDAWRERGTVVIITEWVPGASLEERIRRVAPFPVAVALDIFQTCAAGLHHAHENGFVHGDVRPDNVIITPDGQVKITDFGVGVSAAASARIQMTALHRAAYYLAPEIVDGHAPDARTDAYALGCILFEMLTGKVPFSGETPIAVAVKHLHEPVPSLKALNPALPGAVDSLARKCLSKDPMARYVSLRPLLGDVAVMQEAIRRNLPLEAPVPKPAREAKPAPRPEASVDAGVEGSPVAQRTRTSPPRRREPEVSTDTGPSARLLAGIAVLAVVLFTACFFVVGMFTLPPREVAVPADLVGKSQGAAVQSLEALGLHAEVRNEFRADEAQGNVYEVVPPGGATLRSGKTVLLYVSRGKEPVDVPELIGKNRPAAVEALRQAGLYAGDTKEEFFENFQKGEIASQTPRAGERVPRGSTVNIIISKGPEPIPVVPTEAAADDPGNTTATDPQFGSAGAHAQRAPGLPAGDDAPLTPLPPASQPSIPDGASGTASRREHEVSFIIPAGYRGPQYVQIHVRNEDGTEQNAYDQEHQPGDFVRETVVTYGARSKCAILVYINGRLVSTLKR